MPNITFVSQLDELHSWERVCIRVWERQARRHPDRVSQGPNAEYLNDPLNDAVAAHYTFVLEEKWAGTHWYRHVEPEDMEWLFEWATVHQKPDVVYELYHIADTANPW